jgi:predicted nucleotidyltransferase
MTDPRAALGRLRDAAASGALAALCDRYGADLLVAFGSATAMDGRPNDLDIAVWFRPGWDDLLGFLDELSVIADSSQLDLMDLRRAGPVARERALLKAVRLYEAHEGTLSRARMAAMTERMDTAWLRKLDLELMAR